MINSLMLSLVLMSPDYTSINDTISQTTDVLASECQHNKAVCEDMVKSDLRLVEQLEEIYK